MVGSLLGLQLSIPQPTGDKNNAASPATASCISEAGRSISGNSLVGQPLACGQPVDAYEPEGSGVGCRGVTGTAGRTSGGDSKAPPNLQCKGQKEHLPRIWTTKKGIAESFHCSTSLHRAALETL